MSEKDTDLIEEIVAGEQKKNGKRDEPLVSPKRSSSVVIYLVILFAAAFFLLLMAYFMQKRNSDAVIGNLQNSVSQFQTLDELRDENEVLREELEYAESRIGQLEEDLSEAEICLETAKDAAERAKADADAAQQNLEGHILLLTWYSQLEEALRNEDFDRAATLYHSIMSNHGSALNQFAADLGMVDVDGNVTFDLEARMAEIGDELTKQFPGGADEPVPD